MYLLRRDLKRKLLKRCVCITISVTLFTCVLFVPWDKRYYDEVTGKCSCSSSPETSTRWCSPSANFRGNHQKVVAYSLYGNSSDSLIVGRYFKLLNSLAESIAHHYPGWIMRIYHKYENADTDAMLRLCQFHCSYSNVDLCNLLQIRNDPEVQNLVEPTDLDKLNPYSWRFLPAMDPLVDVFVSRDLDSVITDREVAAVNQWLDSKYTFHLMRDHQFHKVVILGGLWGAKVHQKEDVIRDGIGKLIRSAGDENKFVDQVLLRQHLWPLVKHDVMAHDSYNCQSESMLKLSALPMFPFPTQRREDNDFVGNIITRKKELSKALQPCPVACRPRDHPSWEYC